MTTQMAVPQGLTANDRLKESFGARVWLSLIIATLLHVLPFQLWPAFTVPDWGGAAAEITEVVQLGEVELPPEPAALQRPGVPVVSPNVTAVETIPVLTWTQAGELPPPPVDRSGAGASANGVPFTPFTLAPALLNPDVVQRALRREYPTTARDAGIGGTVEMLVHIDTEGRVTEARIGEGAALTAFNEAALRVAEVMRFRPAMNRDVKVAVWIRLPVTFQVR